MNIQPASLRQERHVTFNETVQVRHFHPDIEQPIEPTQLLPSLHAQRLERTLRAGQMPPARIELNREAQQQRHENKTPFYKKAFRVAACVCGALVIPAFSFLFLGPIGLVVPAALAVSSAIFFALSGKPTPEMEEEQERNRQAMRQWDSRVI